MSATDLKQFMESGEYLPECIRDFHDQKDVFRMIHEVVSQHQGTKAFSWIDAQIYTIDVFLWFMARRGYTLQRSRKHIEFLDLDDALSAHKKIADEAFSLFMKSQDSK